MAIRELELVRVNQVRFSSCSEMVMNGVSGGGADDEQEDV
jgi:hypothetical protein